MTKTILITTSWFAATSIFTAGLIFHLFLLCAFFGLEFDFFMSLIPVNVPDGITTSVSVGEAAQVPEGVINVTKTLEQQFTTKKQ